MEIFKSLSEIENSDVTINVISENVYPEINGRLVITKGILKVELGWWCRVSTIYKMEDYVTTEDIEWDDVKQSIEGLPIDDFHKFKQGLIDHGMRSVSESLTINDSVIREEILKTIPNHKYYQALFGDKKLFETITDEEKRQAYVKVMREDITFIANYNHMKKVLGWVDEEDNILTNEQILELYK